MTSLSLLSGCHSPGSARNTENLVKTPTLFFFLGKNVRLPTLCIAHFSTKESRHRFPSNFVLARPLLSASVKNALTGQPGFLAGYNWRDLLLKKRAAPIF